MSGYAYFVIRPRTIDDLQQPHLLERERPYEIVKEIVLPEKEYENFITDMVADRWFLEENAELCGSLQDVTQCLHIRGRKEQKGVLVVPERAWVYMAAVCPEDRS